MDVTLGQLEAAALNLPPEERARLAERLLSSLEDDPEVTAAWTAEAKRRNAEIESGNVRPIPADQVFASARAKLR